MPKHKGPRQQLKKSSKGECLEELGGAYPHTLSSLSKAHTHTTLDFPSLCRVVLGEPEMGDLIKDPVEQLNTHVELMVSRSEKTNKEKLSMVSFACVEKQPIQ